MKTYEELKNMGIDFTSLEKERQKAIQYRKKKSLPALIIGLISIVVGIMFLFISTGIGATILITGLIIALVYYLIINLNAQEQVKSKIINNFFGKLNMDLIYGDISKSFEFESNLKKAGFKKGATINSEDFISGSLRRQPFVMANVLMSYDFDGGETLVFAFQGPFAFIKTSSNYPYTIIIPNQFERDFGEHKKLMQHVNFASLNQKNIYFKEDSDFEKDFVVWSKDEHFARSIITAPFREYLKGMATIKHDIYIALTDNTIMAGIDIERNLFNFSLKKPIDDAILSSIYDDFAKFYQFMENIYSFVTADNNSATNEN